MLARSCHDRKKRYLWTNRDRSRDWHVVPNRWHQTPATDELLARTLLHGEKRYSKSYPLWRQGYGTKGSTKGEGITPGKCWEIVSKCTSNWWLPKAMNRTSTADDSSINVLAAAIPLQHCLWSAFHDVFWQSLLQYLQILQEKCRKEMKLIMINKNESVFYYIKRNSNLATLQLPHINFASEAPQLMFQQIRRPSIPSWFTLPSIVLLRRSLTRYPKPRRHQHQEVKFLNQSTIRCHQMTPSSISFLRLIDIFLLAWRQSLNWLGQIIRIWQQRLKWMIPLSEFLSRRTITLVFSSVMQSDAMVTDSSS